MNNYLPMSDFFRTFKSISVPAELRVNIMNHLSNQYFIFQKKIQLEAVFSMILSFITLIGYGIDSRLDIDMETNFFMHTEMVSEAIILDAFEWNQDLALYYSVMED